MRRSKWAAILFLGRTNVGMDFLTSDASFEEKVIYALAELNTKVESLVGNGQPGKIAKIDGEIAGLKADVQALKTQDSFTSGRDRVVSVALKLVLPAIVAAIVAVMMKRF